MNVFDAPRRGSIPGIQVAAITALISGVSVFVNSYGVHAIAQPAVYTTAKNVVAAAVLAGLALGATRLGSGWVAGRRWITRPVARNGAISAEGWRSWSSARWLAVAYVGVIGGGAAFILFFDGLARTEATPAAFLHDGLVVWVAILAVPLLRERLNGWNLAAIGLLMGGQVAVLGGIGHLSLGRGDVLVLVATWLWAIEVIICKRLLFEIAPATVSLIRMGVGSAVLLAYLAVTGTMSVLINLSASQLGWALLTGLLLAGYVGTWMTALSRARAVDVTSVLVASTVITTLLSAIAGTVPVAPEVFGLVLIALGVAVLFLLGTRQAVA